MILYDFKNISGLGGVGVASRYYFIQKASTNKNIENIIQFIKYLFIMDAEIIIVGLGCAGLSAAYHSSKSGYKVIGLE